MKEILPIQTTWDHLFSLAGLIELTLTIALLAAFLTAVTISVRLLWGLGFDRRRRLTLLVSGSRIAGALLLGYWFVVRAVKSLPVLSVVFITLVAAALLYAVIEPLQSVVAALVFLLRNRIRRGDEITVGALSGVVKDFNLLHLSLAQGDGTVAWVPNRLVHQEGMVLRARRNAVPITIELSQEEFLLSRAATEQLRDVVLLSPYRSPGTEVTLEPKPKGASVRFVIWSADCKTEAEDHLRRCVEKLVATKR